MLNIRHVKSFCSARKGFFSIPKSKYLLIEIFLKQKKVQVSFRKRGLVSIQDQKKVSICIEATAENCPSVLAKTFF